METLRIYAIFSRSYAWGDNDDTVNFHINRKIADLPYRQSRSFYSPIDRPNCSKYLTEIGPVSEKIIKKAFTFEGIEEAEVQAYNIRITRNGAFESIRKVYKDILEEIRLTLGPDYTILVDCRTRGSEFMFEYTKPISEQEEEPAEEEPAEEILEKQVQPERCFFSKAIEFFKKIFRIN